MEDCRGRWNGGKPEKAENAEYLEKNGLYRVEWVYNRYWAGWSGRAWPFFEPGSGHFFWISFGSGSDRAKKKSEPGLKI